MYRRFHCFAERRIGWGERWKSHKSHVDNRRYRFLYAIHRFFDIHLPELTAVHCYGSRKYFYDVSWSFRDNIWKYARITILMDRRSKIWNHFFFFFTVILIWWYFSMEFILSIRKIRRQILSSLEIYISETWKYYFTLHIIPSIRNWTRNSFHQIYTAPLDFV